MEEVVQECKMGFARKLASPNLRTREKAISLLVTWLTSKRHIENEELKKIWKGLFYCVWHSDKVLVQTELIERLASISEKLDTRLSLQFFTIFLMTMRREWAGIDRLRLDKFYLLLRRYLAHMFIVLENLGWDTNLTKEFMDALINRVFLAEDQHAAAGINLHYADIFLKELERFLPLREDAFRILIEPFLTVIAYALDKSLLQRIRENMFGCLLDHGRAFILAKQNGTVLESATESFGCLVFSWPIGAEAFKLASIPSISQTNRNILFELHKEYETLEKLRNASGVTHSLSAKKKRKKTVQQLSPGGKQKEKKTKHAIKISNENALYFQKSESVEKNGEGLKDQDASSNFGEGNAVEEKGNPTEGNVSTCIFNETVQQLSPGGKRKKNKTKHAIKTSNEDALYFQKSESVEKNGEGLKDQDVSLNFGEANSEEEKGNPTEGNASTCIFNENTNSAEKDGHRRMTKPSKKLSKCLTDPVSRTCEPPLSSSKRSIESLKAGMLLDDFENSNRTMKNCRILHMDDSVISNLKRQFDILAGEDNSESDTRFSPNASITFVSPHNTGSKKRKQLVCTEETNFSGNMESKLPAVAADSNADTPDNSMYVKSSVKAKKVRFALKKNLVWRPTSPLPPESVRVPPSATPRGSALKKGVPPGPIISEIHIAAVSRPRKGTPRRPHISVQKNMKQIRAVHKRRSSI